MKYQFVIMFNEMGESLESEIKNFEGISRLYSDDNEKAKYCFKIFAKDRTTRDNFLEKHGDNIFDKKVVSFSMFPRYISSLEMEHLISKIAESSLQKQLEAYPKAKALVSQVLEHLDMKVPELAAMLDTRQQDVYNWLSMNAKPDKLKIVLLEYLLSCKDWSNDRFISFLMSELGSTMTEVKVVNNKTKNSISTFSKKFVDRDSAYKYVDELKNIFEGLNTSILVNNKTVVRN